MKKATIQLETLTCPSCMTKIEAALKGLNGVNKDSLNVSFNTSKAKVDYDEANPVFGKATDADEWGVNVNFFWNKLWNVEQLSAIFSVAYGESDSDVNFYDTDLTNASVGLLYKF